MKIKINITGDIMKFVNSEKISKEFKSSLLLNWVGFTYIETITWSLLFNALLTNDRWPSWSEPIVGTIPIKPWLFIDFKSSLLEEKTLNFEKLI